MIEWRAVYIERCMYGSERGSLKPTVVIRQGVAFLLYYKWRGGTNTYILNFAKDWPGAKTIIMEDNFRSVDTILEASSALIENNDNRYVKNILAHMSGKNRPVYLRSFTARNIWKLVSDAMLKGGYEAGDIAVIARNNKELYSIQKELKPYVETVSPKVYVIEDAVFLRIRDILSLYMNEMQDDRAFYRFLTYCGCRLDADFFTSGSLYGSLVAAGFLLPITLFDVDCLPEYERVRSESPLMNAGYLLIKAFKAIQYARGPADALNDIFNIIFEDEVHPVLEALLSKVEDRKLESITEVYSYLGYMERYKDTTEVEYPVRKDAVNLLTAHKSKGKEYPMVIVFDTERFEDTEEGRCLLYVAMTRAKRTLYLTEGFVRAPLFHEIKEYVKEYGQA